jgi:hypothetical protein
MRKCERSRRVDVVVEAEGYRKDTVDRSNCCSDHDIRLIVRIVALWAESPIGRVARLAVFGTGHILNIRLGCHLRRVYWRCRPQASQFNCKGIVDKMS